MALHCPATLLIAPVPRDAKGVGDLTASLTGERVLAVVREPGDEVAVHVAAALDVPLEDEPELAEVDAAGPHSALHAIADLHRGETVVVLVPGLAAGETPFVRRELD